MRKTPYRVVGYTTLAFLLYNFIFPIRLIILPSFAELLYLLSLAIFLIYISVKRVNKLLFNKYNYIVACSLVVLLSLACFSLLISVSSDYSVLPVFRNYFFTLIYSACLIGCVRLGFFGEVLDCEDIFKIVVLSCVVIGLSLLLEVFAPACNKAFDAIFVSGNASTSYRPSGISASGGAALSFALSLGCGISLIMALRSNTTFGRAWYYFLAFSIFAASFFTGRTGLIFSAFFVVVSLRYLSLARCLYISIILPICYLVVFQLFSLLPEETSYYFSYHSLEPINNFLDHGSFESATSDAVAGMYFLPDAKHLLLGAGFLSESLHGYLLPDPGYMKVLLAFGIAGFVIFYLLSGFIVFRAYRYLCIFDGRFKLLFFVVLGSFFVYESKEPGLYQNHGFRILMLFFALDVVRSIKLCKQQPPMAEVK